MKPVYRKEKISYEEDAKDSLLNFKDQRIFFETFFTMRQKVIILQTEAKFDKKIWPQLINALDGYIEWSSNYIKDIDTIDNLFERCKKEYKNKDWQTSLKTIKKIVRLLSSEHEKSDILPKKIRGQEEDENLKFWKEEGHAGMREMKKAFYDLFMVNNE